MLVLSWNLFHGRAVPEERRPLLGAFAAHLAGWAWDVALLQEVPPWWPPHLAEATNASERTARTSRNWLLAITRPIADRRPDVVKSWGGGANAILVRGAVPTEHRTQTLRRWPERRVAHAVRLADGTWVANLHGQAHSEARAQADLATAARALVAWSPSGPAILGGDMNTHAPLAPPGFEHAAGHTVDHVLARDLEVVGGRALESAPLSDHAPVLAEVRARKDHPSEAS